VHDRNGTATARTTEVGHTVKPETGVLVVTDAKTE